MIKIFRQILNRPINYLRLGMLLSICIHLLFFQILWSNVEDVPPPQQIIEVDLLGSQSMQDEQEVQRKDDLDDTHIIPNPPPNKTLPGVPNPKECQYYYIGIGITTNHLEHPTAYLYVEVIHVHKGYPAYRAGIQVGDRLIVNEELRDGGPIGSQVTVWLIRDGIVKELILTREKICVEF